MVESMSTSGFSEVKPSSEVKRLPGDGTRAAWLQQQRADGDVGRSRRVGERRAARRGDRPAVGQRMELG